MRTSVRSLRARALAVVLLVVIAPLVFVWLSNVGDLASGTRMKLSVDRVAGKVADAWRESAPQRAAQVTDGLAWHAGMRARVVSSDGAILQDADHEERSTASLWLEAFFFGPDGAPAVRDVDAMLPPLSRRAEVARAFASGRAHGCEPAERGRLLVCQSALRVTLPDETIAVVHVQDGSRRAVRALYDVRYQLLKLTLQMVLIGAVLGGWLGWRMVRPLEQLREQVLARRFTNAMSPVDLARDDEIGDLARAFNELLETLAERNKANAGFIADMAHEMKNPVAAIRACAEAMEGRSLDQERAERLSRVLADSSRRLDQLVTRFLELARAEAGLPGQERARVALDVLAAGLVEMFRADERFRDVTFEIAVKTAVIEGVPERIETALRNLIENAASFAGTGGQVRVDVDCRDGVALVSVKDTGPGIATEDLPRLFDRFFTRRPDGTGLGLALTRAIVEAHAGRIEVHSVPGSGAVFLMRFPSA